VPVGGWPGPGGSVGGTGSTGADGAAGAAGAGAVAGGTAGAAVPKSTCTGARSAATSISKNSRGVKPPVLAMIELGKVWIRVLYDWTLPL